VIAREQQFDDEIIRIRGDKRKVYSTPEGREELAQIILESGVLSEIVCEEGRLLHNIGIRKLEQLGLLDEEGLPGLVNWLLSQPLTYKKTVEEKER
jgi:hypothetical protein